MIVMFISKILDYFPKLWTLSILSKLLFCNCMHCLFLGTWQDRCGPRHSWVFPQLKNHTICFQNPKDSIVLFFIYHSLKCEIDTLILLFLVFWVCLSSMPLGLIHMLQSLLACSFPHLYACRIHLNISWIDWTFYFTAQCCIMWIYFFIYSYIKVHIVFFIF